MSPIATNLLLDADTWDLALEDGNLSISSGYDAASQSIGYRLKFFKGEWFADENIGIPYWTDILKKSPNLPAIKEIFRKTISETPGVDEILSIELAWSDTREISLSFSVRMADDTLVTTDGFLLGAPQ